MCFRTHPTVAAELERARQRSAQLSQDLYGIPVSSSLRSRMAATCFAIAMDHCDGIAILLAHQPPAEASAFALVRSVFDTYVRGLWLANGASDADVRDFSTGELRPTMPPMLKAIGEAPTAVAKSLSHSYGAHWDALCAYAHTGAHQVQRWNTADSIEPRYTEAEVCEVLRFTGELQLMASAALATIAGNQAVASAIEERLITFRASASR